MIKAKKMLTKTLISLLIVLTLFNFIGTVNPKLDLVYVKTEAASTPDDTEEDLNNIAKGGFAGIIWNFVKLGVTSVIRAFRDLNYTLASAGGDKQESNKREITPFDIFFNRFALLDVNIFSTTMNDGEDGKEETPLSEDGIVYKIRTNISIWYYAVRALAISIVAIMLIWNLVRAISKSTSAGQKVVAKNAIMDWVLSFALITFMHIIIIMIIYFNELMLEAIQGFMGITKGPNIKKFVDSIENVIFSDNWTLSIAAMAIYAMLEWQTFKYILVYIQRLFTTLLLVVVSPIIPVTYSTDRMRGGRGTALNSWLRELSYNIFIQSIHALIYCTLVGTALSGLVGETVSTTEDLGVALVAIAGMLFVKYAERIVKTIFGFNNSQILNTNIFSDASNVVIGAGKTVGRSLQRVATGGPLVSFGQNVDGSHIGIGQVASGLGNSAQKTWDGTVGRAWDKTKEVGDSIINGASGLVGGITGTSAAINAAQNYVPNSENNNENKNKNEDNSQIQDAINSLNENSSKEENNVIVTDDNEVTGQNRDNQEDNKSESDKENNEEINTEKNNKTEETEETNETTVIKTKQEHVEEEEEETEENDENIPEEEISDSNGNIVVGMGSDTNPELLNKFKEELKAILNDDKDTLKKWADEAQEKWDEARKKINPDEEKKILEYFSKNWSDKSKIQDYINSFKDGSPEKEYANALNDVFTFVDIDDESNLSKTDKIDSLVESYNSKGLELPPSIIRKMTDSSEVDKLTTKEELEKNKQENKIETKEETKETEEHSKVIDLDERKLKRLQPETRNVVESMAHLGVKVQGRTEAEIATEITNDLEVRLEDMAYKHGTSNIDEIERQLNDDAKEQLENYKNTNTVPTHPEAKELAIMSKELKYIERVAKDKKFELSFDGKYEGTANSTGEVVSKITNMRERKDIEKQQDTRKRA